MGELPLPTLSHPPGKQPSANLSFSQASQAFLLSPPEGNADDSTLGADVEKVISEDLPPSKKARTSTGPGALSATTTPSIGEAFLPLISEVSVPFGLPSAPAAPTFLPVQEPTAALPLEATCEETPQETTPGVSTSLPVQDPASPSHPKDTSVDIPQATTSGASTSLPQQELNTSLPGLEETRETPTLESMPAQSSQSKLCGTSGSRKKR